VTTEADAKLISSKTQARIALEVGRKAGHGPSCPINSEIQIPPLVLHKHSMCCASQTTILHHGKIQSFCSLKFSITGAGSEKRCCSQRLLALLRQKIFSVGFAVFHCFR
jgi:hypothetical protein